MPFNELDGCQEDLLEMKIQNIFISPGSGLKLYKNLDVRRTWPSGPSPGSPGGVGPKNSSDNSSFFVVLWGTPFPGPRGRSRAPGRGF